MRLRLRLSMASFGRGTFSSRKIARGGIGGGGTGREKKMLWG